MKILLTGGAGFIGSHVAEIYLNAGHEVFIIDDLSTGKVKNIPKGAHFKHLSLNAPVLVLKQTIEEIAPDVINHHAAQISVTESVKNPAKDANINILGLLNLINAIKDIKIKRFIFSSSGGTVYGNTDKFPVNEKEPISPDSPYGIAKAASEFYIRFYANTYGFDYSFLRYSNVYGYRQNPLGEAGVVAIFINSILQNKQCTIYGDGNQMRDYVFVKDVAKASLLALSSKGSYAVNIGTGVETSVNELYSKIKAVTKTNLDPIYAPTRPGDLLRNVLNPGLAEKIIGWKPEFSLAQGIAMTFEMWEKQ